MISVPYGAKSKRPGYTTFLANPDNSQVQNLLAFPRNNGTETYLYRASGTQLYYSYQGTGAWGAVAGYGTIGAGNHFDADIIYDQNASSDMFVGGDGQGTTRWTTDGTTFNGSGGLAPSGYLFHTQYGQRIFASGTQTGGTLLYSSANTGTQWNIAAPFDSSNLLVPSDGAVGKTFVAADRLIATKNRGRLFNWDQFSLVDMASNYGPSSPWSIAAIEDYRFWINQYGHYGFDGANVQLLSNPIQRYFFNKQNSGIAGTQFQSVIAGAHFFDYFAAIGTIKDDFTQRTINNAVLNYNYQRNEYLMWQLNDNPTAFLSYNDQNNTRQFIFGNSAGQCFQLDRTATSDNGVPIESEMVMLFTYASSSTAFNQTQSTSISGASYEKKWNWIRLFFNPGCEINIQAAFSNSFTYQHLSWFDIVDNSPNPNNNAGDGIVEFRFPQNSRSRLLFIRLYESSDNSQWTYYGSQIDATPQPIG